MDQSYVVEMFERCDMDKYKEKGGVEGFCKELGSNLNSGLRSDEDGSSFEERAVKYGRNFLPDPPKESWCHMFACAFKDLMLKILLASAVLSVILTSVFPEDGKPKFTDYIDTISIFIAVIIVAFVQTQTDYTQQKSFEEINKLKNLFPISVIRCGTEKRINSTELLVGDILSLRSGDRVAADCLFIQGHELKINNSQETGESQAVEVSESNPFIIGGGAVESGEATALVVAVGQFSQSGVMMSKIQEMSQNQEKSPLEKKLEKVAIILTYIGIAGSALTFLVLLIKWSIYVAKAGKFHVYMLTELVKHFMTGVTIFICAVPEGLPLAVTISLGFSMRRMMNDNNFVRHLSACETMGGATTICSDKTGTLTQNKMTVVSFFQIGKLQGNNPQMSPEVLKLFGESVAINTTAFQSVNGEKTEYVGQSSECAILQMLPLYGLDYRKIREENPKLIIHEFSSSRKRMSTVAKVGQSYFTYVKGAPDFLIPLCDKYMDAEGEIKMFDADAKAEAEANISLFAQRALRTMLIGFRKMNGELKENWKTPEKVEKKLTMLAIVGIEDPLRPEVVTAIEKCKKASVVVRMVTGDFIETAKAIAAQCGILNEGDIAMVGKDFASKSKIELLDILPSLKVIGRSSPRDKYRLVSLLMECGEVVAVTGDGSNDSAALKKANVGLSMGKCGTELAKMASDIVILDDNFNSIVNALKWGRCIYDNVRGFLQFQLTVNFTAMVIAFVGSIVLTDSPLKTMQLLWVNLIMDSFGALALATSCPSEQLLNRPPYGESDGLISNILVRNIIGMTAYNILSLFLILFLPSVFGIDSSNSTLVSTMIFNTFVYQQAFNLINSRVTGADIDAFQNVLKNPYFVSIFLAIGIIQAVIVEFLGSAFEVTSLNWKNWLICLGFGAGTLVIGLFLRLIKLPDRTTEKLNALRQERNAEMRKKYEGKTFDEQWAEEPLSYTAKINIKP